MAMANNKFLTVVLFGLFFSKDDLIVFLLSFLHTLKMKLVLHRKVKPQAAVHDGNLTDLLQELKVSFN